MENDESTATIVLPKVALASTSDDTTLETPAGEREITQDDTRNTTHLDGKVDDERLTEERGGKDGQEVTSIVETPDVQKPADSQTTSSTPASSTTSVPHVKKFSAVNINKKFLEKASSGSSVGSNLTNTGLSKQTGSIVRPSPQSTSSASRLITSKLAGVPTSTTPTAGWSRPSSATPPTPIPTSRTNSSGGVGTASALNTTGSNSNHALGRPVLKQQKNEDLRSTSRPAWRNVVPLGRADFVRPSNDFPTAAEAAQGEMYKVAEAKAAQVAAVEASVAQQQALSESAATFRGAHLDPNAFHWDEIDDDDNAFVDEVIEFGDGVQYTIQANDASSKQLHDNNEEQPDSEAPVNKEDRFADDFDRSWPKSRNEDVPHVGNHDGPIAQRRTSFSESSSNPSHSPVSLRDPSQPRVLFNERSNRMEPAVSRAEKRPDQQDSRGRQDGPSWNSRPGGVMLLHKATHDAGPLPHVGHDGRRDSAYGESFHNSDRFSDPRHERRPWGAPRGPPHRPDGHDSHVWVNGRRDPSSSRNTVNGASSVASSDNGRSSVGISGLPTRSGREAERQLPPHLQNGPPRDPWKQSPWQRRPSHSTQASNDMAERESVQVNGAKALEPDVANDQPPPTPAPLPEAKPAAPAISDVGELQKAVLHDTADRARRRRQEEEEERLRAQQRAKQKAAELEARLAAAAEASKPKAPAVSLPSAIKPAPSEEAIVTFIEDAVKMSPTKMSHQDQAVAPSINGAREEDSRHSLGRAPPRPLTVSDRSESWRRPSAATPASESRRVDGSMSSQREKAPPPSFIPPHSDSLDVKPGEELEIVDFNDMGKFTGSGVADHSSSEFKVPGSARRPVASDFFEDVASNEEHVSWRNSTAVSDQQVYPVSLPPNAPPPIRQTDDGHKPSAIEILNRVLDTPIGTAFTSPRMPKSPMPQTYREAPLSALDDTMSRIKGALDTMHSGKVADVESPSKPQTQNAQDVLASAVKGAKVGKWLPPARRAGSVPYSLYSRSPLFAVTSPEPPRSPAPPLNRLTIGMPKKDSRVAWIPPRKHSFILKNTTCYVRWDIMSFDPPVDGMTKKSLSLNDVLFKKPPGVYKRGFQHTVVLPKSTNIQRLPLTAIVQPSAPVLPIRINLSSVPSGKSFAKSASEDGNWRASKADISLDAMSTNHNLELNVTSRSPPPDPASLKEHVAGQPQMPSDSRQSTSSGSKMKAPQGMPEGADLAFYRDARGTLTNTRKVSFTVSSELDDEVSGPNADESADLLANIDVAARSRTDSRKDSMQLIGTSIAPLLSLTEADDQESEDKIQNRILEHTIGSVLSSATPPPRHAVGNPWSKSPSRIPDPEVLKAVWSQTSDKDDVPTVNSLKGIADDLTTLPFSLHEVKSEDGGTPPPATSGPLRMSASDVTKAFQMVPSGSSNTMSPSSSRSNNLFSSAVTSPTSAPKPLKPTTSGHTQMQMNGIPRPHYMGYPPHLSSHTPSPPMMYPHMGSGALQSQPMWMPMPPQQGPGMMRGQQSSPYSPSMMPYHGPTGANGIYPQVGVNHTGPTPPGYPGAPHMMVSPVMTHTNPVPPHMMYGASPVMLPVQAPGMPPPSQAYPGPIGMGRGGTPIRSGMDNRPPQAARSTHPPQARFPPVHNPSYSHLPTQPFVRPSW